MLERFFYSLDLRLLQTTTMGLNMNVAANQLYCAMHTTVRYASAGRRSLTRSRTLQLSGFEFTIKS